MRALATLGGAILVLLVIVELTSPPIGSKDVTNSTTVSARVATDNAHISPEELPLWITVYLTELEKSGKLSTSEITDLEHMPDLVIQDKWNEEMGITRTCRHQLPRR
jgi:hypothetical protein